MVNSALQHYSYSLAADDRIAAVNAEWLAFAQENGASELTQDAVLGKPLWSFVSGRETQELYAAIFRRVRCEGLVATIPFRCDSPTLRRYMLMRVSKSDDLLVLECTLTRVETTNYLRLLDRGVPRDERQLTVCSLCRHALVEPVGWLQLEDAAVRLRLLEETTGPRFRYTICPPCANLAVQSPN